MDGPPTCELCELAPITTWYAEIDVPFRFRIVECESCEAPMAVLGDHRATVTEEERAVMAARLAEVADRLHPDGWFLCDAMRQIPEHYHLHARPIPAWARALLDDGGNR